jgi:hypothetical protein
MNMRRHQLSDIYLLVRQCLDSNEVTIKESLQLIHGTTQHKHSEYNAVPQRRMRQNGRLWYLALHFIIQCPSDVTPKIYIYLCYEVHTSDEWWTYA